MQEESNVEYFLSILLYTKKVKW